MRIVLQRVKMASVTIDQTIAGAIEKGYLILLGITHDDNTEDINWLINKVKGLRIFSDEEGKMNLNLSQVSGDILLISQFTLFASTKKGNRPSYINSAKPDIAIPLYDQFVSQLRNEITPQKLETGKFGADMQVALVNDGPVTIVMDSKNKE